MARIRRGNGRFSYCVVTTWTGTSGLACSSGIMIRLWSLCSTRGSGDRVPSGYSAIRPTPPLLPRACRDIRIAQSVEAASPRRSGICPMSRKNSDPRCSNISILVNALHRHHVAMTTQAGSRALTWLPMRIAGPGATRSAPSMRTAHRRRSTRMAAMVAQ